MQHPRKLFAVGFDGEQPAGLKEKNSLSKTIGILAKFGQHPAKGLAAIGWIHQHAFLPSELRVEAQVVVTGNAVALADMAIENLKGPLAGVQVEFSRGRFNQLPHVLLKII